MKKNIYLILCMAFASVEVYATEGALKGKFTCNDSGEHIMFAKGNLQYQASTDTWRFAEHQYDYVGNDVKGNVYVDTVKCSNKQMSDSYSGWIDTYVFGTSGWNGGQTAYQPWSTSTKAADYLGVDSHLYRYIWGTCLSCGDESSSWLKADQIDSVVLISPTNEKSVKYYYYNYYEVALDYTKDTMQMVDWKELTGEYRNADWGVNNAISNGGKQAGLWRTPSWGEWNYIRNSRPRAAELCGKGKVDTVAGIILLPDDWELPEGLTFNSMNTNVEQNNYTKEEWMEMETAGAVFLPFGGVRGGTEMYEVGTAAAYASNLSYASARKGMTANLHSTEAMIGRDFNLYYGLSVRLVQGVTCKLTIVESENGSVWVANQGLDLNQVKENTEVQLYAVPAEDSYFVGWSNGEQANPLVLTMTEDMTIEPLFSRCEEQVVTLDETILKGESYRVGEKEYTRRGTYVDTLTTTNGCDSVVILNLEVVKSLTYNIRVVLNDSTMGTVSGSGDFAPGTEVTITATPTNDKYVFIRWYNEDENIDVYENPFSFNLNRDLQLRAVFRRRNGKE